MRTYITKLFLILTTIIIFLSLILGIAWLFDSEPKNLIWLCKFIGKIYVCFFGVQLLFGEKITFK